MPCQSAKDSFAERSPELLCHVDGATPSTSSPGTPTSVLQSRDELSQTPTPECEAEMESAARLVEGMTGPETKDVAKSENIAVSNKGDAAKAENEEDVARSQSGDAVQPAVEENGAVAGTPTGTGVKVHPQTLHVLTWNILAHQFTSSIKRFHLAETETGRESTAQTAARYATATTSLLKQIADVVLLQECPAAFLAPELKLNPHAVTLQSHYRAYCCFGADGTPTSRRRHPGCAILLRRASPLQVLDAVAVDGCDDFGGKHYTGLALLLHTTSLGKAWVATVHQCHESPLHISTPKKRQGKRGALLRALHAAMMAKDDCQRIILGGDFGASGEPALDRELLDIEEVERCTWLGRSMSRVQAHSPVALRQMVYNRERTTGLNPSWQYDVSLDYFYLSRNLEAPFVRTGGTPRCPYARDTRGEWKCGTVVAASDHVWLEMEVRCYPPQPPEASPLYRTAASVWNVPIVSIGCDAPDGVPWQYTVSPASPTPSGNACARPSVPSLTAAAVGSPAAPSQQGRRIKMVRARFGLNVGEVATVIGESKTHSSWQLDSGCTVLKTHEGLSWVWLDTVHR
eukprot:GGOE01033263.1.p1 GENE.GGOE01033263.1~~GGOE01033263.1.p1  ORF type:complete len:573 (+),score=131.24 GGOE01033263.1:54-1772(+)